MPFWPSPRCGGGTDPALSTSSPAARLYLAGTILVTMVFNVPRNNALGAVDPGSADGATLWARFVESWTAWNHVRAAAALAAAASLSFALVRDIP